MQAFAETRIKGEAEEILSPVVRQL